MNTTFLPEEVEKFSKIADEWWDINGKFRPLHLFNPVRLHYIRDIIQTHFSLNANIQKNPLSGINILDIGCGGGLLSEPMARLGADVTGVDASERNIKTAQIHAESNELKINYICNTAENLTKSYSESFDVILNMEVIEHVANPEFFMQSCAKLLKPNGIMFVATLNRTLKSYALAIVGAEYILRWLPIGTHDWNKFLKPNEIEKMAQSAHLSHHSWQGVSFNPLTQKWIKISDISVNYMGYFIKSIKI